MTPIPMVKLDVVSCMLIESCNEINQHLFGAFNVHRSKVTS